MDFKKLASDAGTFLTRAKQYTEEKLLSAEKTELDEHIEKLLEKADQAKEWTEKLIKHTEILLQPNPNVRLEEYLTEKIQGTKPNLMMECDVLGQVMTDAGNSLGPGTGYGGALIKYGEVQKKLGSARTEFISAVHKGFIVPLKAFLDGDLKTLQKERHELELKRLDLDSAKNKMRRAKAGAKEGSSPAVDTAEAELRVAQAEYDRQAEVTKLLLENIESSNAHHLKCLQDFINAERDYFNQCHKLLSELSSQVGSN